MNIFRKRESVATLFAEEPNLPKAAVCFTTPARTRRTADWLESLGGCRPLGILSDDCSDVVWQCDTEQADLLLMETNFSGEEENSQDISSRCDIAIEVRRKRPECRIYLLCETGHPEKLPALEKAAELELIDGYYIGNLTAQQMRAWLNETEETMKTAEGG